MTVKEEIIKSLDRIPQESLEAVLDYIHFLMEPEEAEPTEDEIKAIAQGRKDFEKGEFVKWRELKSDAL